MRPLPRILETIRATKKAEIEALLARTPLAVLERAAVERLERDPPRPFEAVVAVREGRPHVIAEIKKASPSKGVIRPDFDPVAIATAYHRGGAAAISCLTDAPYFQGSLAFLAPVRDAAPLPVLRKDFLIHPAQILESCAHGADAVLLIARMLDAGTLASLLRLAKDLRLGVLLEIHDPADLEKALCAGPTLLGINNRDLDTFVVDVETTFRLLVEIPTSIPVVAESGIATPDDLLRLAEAGIAAVLVGESLMREPDPETALRRLRGEPAATRHD